MKRAILMVSVLALVSTAWADWNEGDPAKMVNPQLPNPQGWDIDMTTHVLADDWICSETGLVDDIHFWYSVRADVGQFQLPHIEQVNVSIHKDIPAGESGFGWSMPGQALRNWTFAQGQFVVAGPFPGLQGWDVPEPQSDCLADDHTQYWQVNIEDISNLVTEPFSQTRGEIYWLDLNVLIPGDHLVGWKTTFDVANDAAVYFNPEAGAGEAPWLPIAVCTEDRPTDLAFVITPEPATLALLTLGAVAVLGRRRR